MKVEQIKDIVNQVNKQVLGKEPIEVLDLNNVVKTGEEIFNSKNYDNYVNALVDVVGKYVFVDRVYNGSAPKVLRDSWEFGSLLLKIRFKKLPKAQTNQVWELVDGQTYDESQFYQPKIVENIWNDTTTFMVPISITQRQVKSAFTGIEQLNRFLDMIFTGIQNSLTVQIDALIMLTIDNMISLTLRNEYGSEAYNTKSTAKAVNLLYLYNQGVETPLTKQQAIRNKDFLRFSAEVIKDYSDNMVKMSSVFNIQEADRFTPKELQHLIILGKFSNAIDVNLQSDTWHNELTKLPYYEKVSMWQGSGKAFSFDDCSKISIKDSNGDTTTLDYIVGVLFDRDALGVNQYNERVDSKWLPMVEFTNYWYKRDGRYFNATDENFVVFFLA